MKNIITLLMILLLCVSPVMAEANVTQNAENNLTVCYEQLEFVVGEYNNMTEDYHSGLNCGMAFAMIKDFNNDLGDRLEICKEELGESKAPSYKIPFWIVSIVLLILALSYVIEGIRSKE